MINNALQNFFNDYSNLVETEKQREVNRPGELILLDMFYGHYELCHSNTIAYLLNPKERHKHGTEYLSNFLKTIYGDTFLLHDLSTVEVLRESQHIDILIKHKDFAIIIENKVESGDRPKQLISYYHKMLKEYVNDKIYVTYLTLDGNEPSDDSLGKDNDILYNELKGKLVCISYSKHILDWLKSLTFKIGETRLSTAIAQYILNIENLTGQLQEDKDMVNEIVKKLIKDYHFNDDEYKDLVRAVAHVQDLNNYKKLHDKIMNLIGSNDTNLVSSCIIEYDFDEGILYSGLVIHNIKNDRLTIGGFSEIEKYEFNIGIFTALDSYNNIRLDESLEMFIKNKKYFDNEINMYTDEDDHHEDGWYNFINLKRVNEDILDKAAEYCVDLYNHIDVAESNGIITLKLKETNE